MSTIRRALFIGTLSAALLAAAATTPAWSKMGRSYGGGGGSIASPDFGTTAHTTPTTNISGGAQWSIDLNASIEELKAQLEKASRESAIAQAEIEKYDNIIALAEIVDVALGTLTSEIPGAYGVSKAIGYALQSIVADLTGKPERAKKLRRQAIVELTKGIASTNLALGAVLDLRQLYRAVKELLN